GRAIALALGAAGHPVALGARRVDRCEATVAEIVAAGGAAVAVPLDVSDEASVAARVKRASADLGDIDVVGSNAGNGQPGSVIGTEPSRFAAEIGVNLLGVQTLLHHAVPSMVGRGHGDVVIVTSEV